MAFPSSLQVLGGPLGGQRLEFGGGEVFLGSAPDCAVRLEAPGVEAYHARVVTGATGATIYPVDGILGVNDDQVPESASLRSGDFVWIGEPGGPESTMLQFTLGEFEESAPELLDAMMVEEVVSEELVEHGETVEDLLLEEAHPEAMEMESVSEAEMAEMEPELLETPILETPIEVEHQAEFEPSALDSLVGGPADSSFDSPLDSLDEPIESMTLEEQAGDLPLPSESASAALPGSGSVSAVDPDLDRPADIPASLPSMDAFKVVPPAPWQLPSASLPEPTAAADYASAWESAPAPAAAPESEPEEIVEEEIPEPEPPPAPPPPPPPRAASAPVSGSTKRPELAGPPKAKIRTAMQEEVLRTPPPAPPARTTSSTPLVIGGLVALVVAAAGGYLLTREERAPAAPVSTPTPMRAPAPVMTPQPAPPEAIDQGPAVESAPTPSAPVPAAVAPTPRTAVSPGVRATPPPRNTPAPASSAPRPGAPAPSVAPPAAAAPAAPVSQAPRLLEEARAAASARDLPKASQLLDQVLRLEPGSRDATALKAEVTARLAALGRKFSVGTTTVLGGKVDKKGPTGFDISGGVVKTDFSAQIRCTTTPVSIESGVPFTVRCSILNIGTKAFKLASIAVSQTLDGAKTGGAGTVPPKDIAPQSDAVILERSGNWTAKTDWSIEIVARTTKAESFRAVYSWR